MSGPFGTCNGDPICESSNFGYYWTQHWIAYSRSLGITPILWFLDVESGEGFGSDFASNNAVINGAIAGIRAFRDTPGIYSSALQWGQITGNQASYPGISLWTPGATTLSNDPKSAMALCTGTVPNYGPFAGGTLNLVQFGYINGPPFPFDQNYTC
jgi:hypothetical protein